jgi:hypothetical protein
MVLLALGEDGITRSNYLEPIGGNVVWVACPPAMFPTVATRFLSKSFSLSLRPMGVA